MNWRVASPAAIVLAIACSNESSNKRSEPFQAGFALRDVSPTGSELSSGELFMGAYGVLGSRIGSDPTSGAALGVHDPIFARTLVLRHGETSVAMSVLDMPGMSNRVIREIVAGASQATGMNAETIYIGSTHSHSAPDMQGLWGGVPDAYRLRLIELSIQSIVDAHAALTEAEIFVSTGSAPNRNRRGWEMTDEDLTVLDAKTPNGDRIATLIQFAAHPVKLGALNRDISRDYPGYTVDHAEARLNGPVLFFNGIVGDCSPDGGESQPGCDYLTCEYQEAESYGILVAEAALAAMNAGATRISPALVTGYQTWDQEVTNPAFIALNDAGFLDYDSIAVGDAGMGIRTQGAYFRLGTELQGVAFPGEALTRTGIVIKGRMKTSHRLFLGLTTDSLGYFVPADEWNTGRNNNYEETVSMGLGAAERAIDVIGGLVTADDAF